MVRTTPPQFTQAASCDFVTGVFDKVGATCNVVLSDMQRTRREGCARLSTKLTLPALLLETPPMKCALKSGMDTGEIKTLGMNICEALWDALDIMLLFVQNAIGWRSEASPERVHLKAYSATSSSHEISLVPSKTFDTHLSPCEFVNTVSRRVGIDFMDSGWPCS